jgi:SAM-dependent methyltransferase
MKLLRRLADNRARMSEAGEDASLSAASRIRFVISRALIARYARGTVLDVGCGRMPFRDDIVAAGARYEGLDIEARAPGVDHIGDVQDLHAIADDSFETVTCFEVLEHVPNPARAVSELARILKPGGSLLVTVPHLSRLHEQPHDYYRYTGYGLRALAEQAGLRVVEVGGYGGLASFLGHQASTMLLGLTWGIPGVSSAARALNRAALIGPIVQLDRLDRSGLFALGFALVAAKP